jgi:hypothetical protein
MTIRMIKRLILFEYCSCRFEYEVLAVKGEGSMMEGGTMAEARVACAYACACACAAAPGSVNK